MRCLQIWVHAWIRWSGFIDKPEFNGRSVADSVMLSQGVKGRYKRPLTRHDFIGLWKEKRYRRNMMFLFAGHSDKPQRVLSPWLTKEIIFVCTVFLSFTLWMTCERTLIFAQFTLWIAPQNLQFTLWNSRLWSVYKRGRISCFDFMNIVSTIITIT